MGGCSVAGCNKQTETKSKGITFHRFPYDPETKIRWLRATGRQNWTPKKSSTICSEHFPTDSFYRSRNFTSCAFFKPVKKKNGSFCVGPCRKWMHYKCIEYSPATFKSIKKGPTKILFLCPDCNPASPQENIVNGVNDNRKKKYRNNRPRFSQAETQNSICSYSGKCKSCRHKEYLESAFDNTESNKDSFVIKICPSQHYKTLKLNINMDTDVTFSDVSNKFDYYGNLGECCPSVGIENYAITNQPKDAYVSCMNILHPYIAINQILTDFLLPIQQLCTATNQISTVSLLYVHFSGTINNQAPNASILSIGSQSSGTHQISNNYFPPFQSSHESLFTTERPPAKDTQNSAFFPRSYVVAYSSCIPMFTNANQSPSNIPFVRTQYYFRNQLPCSLPGVFMTNAYSPYVVSSVLPPFLMSQPPCFPFHPFSRIPCPLIKKHVKENKNASSPGTRNSQSEIPMRRYQLRKQKKQFSVKKGSDHRNFSPTNTQRTLYERNPKQFPGKKHYNQRKYSTTNTQRSASPNNLKTLPNTNIFLHSRHQNQDPKCISTSSIKSQPANQQPSEHNERQYANSYQPQELFIPMKRSSCPLACPYNSIKSECPSIFLRTCPSVPPEEPEKKRPEWKYYTGSKPQYITKKTRVEINKLEPKYQQHPYPPSLPIIQGTCPSIILPPCTPLFLRPCSSSPPSPKKTKKKLSEWQCCTGLNTTLSPEHTFVDPQNKEQIYQLPRLNQCPYLAMDPSSSLIRSPRRPIKPSPCPMQSPCSPIKSSPYRMQRPYSQTKPSPCQVQCPYSHKKSSPCQIQCPRPPINPSSRLFQRPLMNQPPSLIRDPYPPINLPRGTKRRPCVKRERRSSLKEASNEQPPIHPLGDDAREKCICGTEKTRSSIESTLDDVTQSQRSSVKQTADEAPQSRRSTEKSYLKPTVDEETQTEFTFDEAPQSPESSGKPTVDEATQTISSSVEPTVEEATQTRRSSVKPTVKDAPQSRPSYVKPTVDQATQTLRSSVDEARKSRRSYAKPTVHEETQIRHSFDKPTVDEATQTRRSSVKPNVDETPQRRISTVKPLVDEANKNQIASEKSPMDETPQRRRSSIKPTIEEAPQSKPSSGKPTIDKAPQSRPTSLNQPSKTQHHGSTSNESFIHKTPLSESQNRGPSSNESSKYKKPLVELGHPPPSAKKHFKSKKQPSAAKFAGEPIDHIQRPSSEYKPTKQEIEAPAVVKQEKLSREPTVLKPRIPLPKKKRTPEAKPPITLTPKPTVDEAPKSRPSSVKLPANEAPQSENLSGKSAFDEEQQSRRLSVETTVDEVPQIRPSPIQPTDDKAPQNRTLPAKDFTDDAKPTLESQYLDTSPNDSFKSDNQSSSVAASRDLSEQKQRPLSEHEPTEQKTDAAANLELEEPSHVPTVLKPHVPSAKSTDKPTVSPPRTPKTTPPQARTAKPQHTPTANLPIAPADTPPRTATAKPPPTSTAKPPPTSTAKPPPSMAKPPDKTSTHPPTPTDIGPKPSEHKDSIYSQTGSDWLPGDFMSKFINLIKCLAGPVNNVVGTLSPPCKMDSCACSRWIYSGRY